jgi:hypothetical protein
MKSYVYLNIKYSFNSAELSLKIKFWNQEIFKKIIYFNDFVPKVYELNIEEWNVFLN